MKTNTLRFYSEIRRFYASARTIVLWSGLLSGVLGMTNAFAQQDYVATMQTVRSSALVGQATKLRSLKIEKVVLDSAAEPVTLDLERFDVFAPDAQIIIHREHGEEKLQAPQDVYYRGGIEGQPESVVVLSADTTGGMRGIVQKGEKFWILAGGAEAGGPAVEGLSSLEIKQSGLSNTTEPLQCDVDHLPKALRTPRPIAKKAIAQALPAGQFYNVPVAIETDGEFFTLFGSSSAATSYIGNLFAYASTIYQRELSTKLTVSHISLWAGGPSSDPWNHTSAGQGLTNFRDYWNANRQSVKRATAHFLSGRNLGGGIAYMGVLCNTSYGYGYSSSISGSFQITNPKPVWDLVGITHEIGHNFNSPHTHAYQGISNNSNPVDACTSGSLPGVNSLTGGTPGAGNGTLMSYCQQLGGGMSNIALKFGLNHPYGIAPSRVNNLMSAFVAQTASTYPSCISVVSSASYTLSTTKAGIGVGTITSSPAGINCGTDCSESYGINTVVNLVATPSAGSVFAGWSGACTGTAGCQVTMSAAKSVTATFNKSAATYLLTVTKNGTGLGAVASNPAGIICGTDCNQIYPVNTVVTLTPTPNTGSVFASWSGACTGTGACRVTMSAAKSVTATFNKITGPDLIVTAVTSPIGAKIGGAINVSVTVKNQGVTSASSSIVAFLFSRDTTVTTSDTSANASCTISTLAAGASMTCTGTISVPTSLPAGTYYLGGYADRNAQVAESSEINNGRAASNTIVVSQ